MKQIRRDADNRISELTAALVEAHQQVLTLQARLAEAQWIEEALRKRTRDLSERTKELECLYRIFDCLRERDRGLGQLLQSVVETIPRGYQRPDATSALLTIGGRKFMSRTFRSGPASHACSIRLRGCHIGELCVFVSTTGAGRTEPVILPEEHALLHAVATWIGEVVRHRTDGFPVPKNPDGGHSSDSRNTPRHRWKVEAEQPNPHYS